MSSLVFYCKLYLILRLFLNFSRFLWQSLLKPEFANEKYYVIYIYYKLLKLLCRSKGNKAVVYLPMANLAVQSGQFKSLINAHFYITSIVIYMQADHNF